MDVHKTQIEEFIQLRQRLSEEHKQYESAFISVGDFTYGVPKIYAWDEGAKLVIGKFCSIAENVIIMLGGDHRTDWNTTYPFNALLPESFGYIKGHPSTKGDIIIGNDVWIAQGAKIMSGVTIGDGAVIAANAVVTKNVKPYEIVGGVPARVIKKRFSRKTIQVLEEICWWDWEVEKIAKAVPYLQSADINSLVKIYNNQM